MTDRARTVFLGTGSFAVPIVAALAGHPSIELAAIVTAPRRVGSRGKPTEPPVALWAADHGLATMRPARLRSDESIDALGKLEPELLVLADYGQIVPAALLDLPRHGALNLHPSLLPRYRGATPIPAAILAGDQETGITLMRMDAGLDTGPIVAQRRVELELDETAPQLEERLANEAASLLHDILDPWLAGSIEPIPQDDRNATLTKPLRREDGRLDPTRTAAELERQVRAYQPWPGSFLETNHGRLIVWQAKVGEDRGGLEVGALIRDELGRLSLAAADRLVELSEVQLAGAKRMSGAELLRGRPDLVAAAPSADTGS